MNVNKTEIKIHPKDFDGNIYFIKTYDVKKGGQWQRLEDRIPVKHSLEKCYHKLIVGDTFRVTEHKSFRGGDLRSEDERSNNSVVRLLGCPKIENLDPRCILFTSIFPLSFQKFGNITYIRVTFTTDILRYELNSRETDSPLIDILYLNL